VGAAGQLDREVVRALGARGHTVSAVVRRPPVSAIENSVEVGLADARYEKELAPALQGVDALVNVIGGGTLRRNDVASTTTAVAMAAAQEIGIHRYIAMSAGMLALDRPLFKYVLVPLIFRHILAEHRRVEEIVRASALAWTIVRPSALTNRPARGHVASLKPQPRAFLTTRADVAAFIADEIESNKFVPQAVFTASRRA